MQNHVPIRSSVDQPNHIPDEMMGRENMPAPTAVPVTIVMPGNKESGVLIISWSKDASSFLDEKKFDFGYVTS